MAAEPLFACAYLSMDKCSFLGSSESPAPDKENANMHVEYRQTQMQSQTIKRKNGFSKDQAKAQVPPAKQPVNG